MQAVDVIVAGLGALGSATARALARQGLSVLGLDVREPPHPWGSSHGGSRIIRRVYPEGSSYLPLLEPAYRAWRRLESESGEPLLLRTGCLFLGRPGGDLVERALASARQGGLEHQSLSAAEIGRRFAALRLPEKLAGVLDPEAGVLRLEACLEAMLRSAAAAGAALRFGSRLDSWESGSGGVVATLADGAVVRARHLVLATGPWLAEMLAPGALEVERQVQHWFRPPGGGPGPDELPPFVWELEPARTWYAIPDLGEGVKAALHHGGATTTAESVDRRVGAAEVAAVRALVERYLPAAAGPCRLSRVCLYANTPEHRFLAGPLPGAPGVWLLGGGSGHAFKFAPLLGELLAETMLGRGPLAELEPFLPPPATL